MSLILNISLKKLLEILYLQRERCDLPTHSTAMVQEISFWGQKPSNEQLKVLVEVNPKTTIRELLLEFYVFFMTISTHLQAIGKVKNLINEYLMN